MCGHKIATSKAMALFYMFILTLTFLGQCIAFMPWCKKFTNNFDAKKHKEGKHEQYIWYGILLRNVFYSLSLMNAWDEKITWCLYSGQANILTFLAWGSLHCLQTRVRMLPIDNIVEALSVWNKVSSKYQTYASSFDDIRS